MFFDEKLYREKIVWLSFFLSLGILLTHTTNIQIYGLTDGVFYRLQCYVANAAYLVLAVFFMLSGFLFYQNFHFSEMTRKLRSRFHSLVIPYVIWGLMGYLYYELLTCIPLISARMNMIVDPFSFKNAFMSVLTAKYNILWFIRDLIVFVLLTPLIFIFIRFKTHGVILFLLLNLCHVFHPSIFLKNLILFLAGALIGLHWRNYVQRSYDLPVRMLSCVMLFCTTVLSIGFIPSLNFIMHTPLTLAIQVAAVWIASDAFMILPTPPWWARLSFAIYVMHSMILESVEKVFLHLFGRTYLGAVIDFVAAPFITLFLIFLVAKVCQRVIPRAWRIMLGGRS